jgi:hypothetical protein
LDRNGFPNQSTASSPPDSSCSHLALCGRAPSTPMKHTEAMWADINQTRTVVPLFATIIQQQLKAAIHGPLTVPHNHFSIQKLGGHQIVLRHNAQPILTPLRLRRWRLITQLTILSTTWTPVLTATTRFAFGANSLSLISHDVRFGALLSLSKFETSGSRSTVEKSWWTPAAPKGDDVFLVAEPHALVSSFMLALDAVEETEICTYPTSMGTCGGRLGQHFAISNFMQSSHIIRPPQMS